VASKFWSWLRDTARTSVQYIAVMGAFLVWGLVYVLAAAAGWENWISTGAFFIAGYVTARYFWTLTERRLHIDSGHLVIRIESEHGLSAFRLECNDQSGTSSSLIVRLVDQFPRFEIGWPSSITAAASEIVIRKWQSQHS
jgi:hypothetical protein